MAVAGPITAGVVRSKPRYVEPGEWDLWLPLHTLFVVFVFVVFVLAVFVCVYWRQCLYHPVGTPSGLLQGERRSYLRLGRHLSKKKKSSDKWTLFRLSLSLCLSASLPLGLSVSLSLSRSLSLFLSLSLPLSLSLYLSNTHTNTHTLSLSLGVVCPLYIM